MTQEEKELLLKDLCTRLPYGVVIHTYYNKPIDIKCTGCDLFANTVNLDIPNDDEAKVYVENVRPYLRPMSSMTEEEKEELKQEHVKDTRLLADALTKTAEGDTSMRGKVILHFAVDWCNKNHFDYRGLIPMGLALEAPEGMYKNE